MDAEHASIAEIRTALGGRCDWVTRRMLKRVGNPFPGRQQIAGWADDPPEWFPREQARRAARARRQQSEKVTIACPGCGFAIQVRPAAALYAQERDGLRCGRRACGYRPPAAPPGLITEITWNAAGSLSGWRHAFPDDEDIASIGRAQDLLAAGQAMQPGSAAQATMKALVAPAGPGDHIVTVSSWSTSVSVAPDGSIEIENPMVCAGLHRMVTNGDEAGIIVRGFSSEISHTLPNGTGIPVKDVRGRRLSEGIVRPIAEHGIFAACCTGARNGEPIAPGRGARYADAGPVEA